MSKGKSKRDLVAESFDWNEESLSSEDERVTKVKEFMAIIEDEPSVGKVDARSGQWLKIIMKKVQRLISMTGGDERKHVLDYTHVDLHYVEDQRKNLLNKFNFINQELSSVKYELCDLKNNKALNCSLQNEIARLNLENKSLKDEISELKKVIEKWTSSKVTLDQLLTKKIPSNIVRALGRRGKRKDTISSKEVLFTKENGSPSETASKITFDFKSECDNQEPLPSFLKLLGAEPINTSSNISQPADLTQTSIVSDKTIHVNDKKSSVKTSMKKAQTKSPSTPDPNVVKKTDSSTKDHLVKFDEKADDGFFLGYSPIAKAFRDFNSPDESPKFIIDDDHPVHNKPNDSESTDNLEPTEIQESIINEPISEAKPSPSNITPLDEGFIQEEGNDYDVARLKAIMIFLAYAAYMGFMKAELHSLKLGDLSIDAYFCKIEFIATISTSLGSHISNDDVVTIALEGFPDKYENVSNIIVHQEPFLDLKMVCSMLTTEEMLLKSRAQATSIDSTSFSSMVLLANLGQPAFVGSSGQPAGHETLFPNEFNAMTLQDPTSGAWNMDTSVSSYLNNPVNSLSDIFNMCIYPSVLVGDGYSIPVINSGHSILPTFHRLLHLRSEVLRHLISSHSISCNKEKPLVLCHAFQLGKHMRLPFYATEILERAHMVGCNPIRTPVDTESKLGDAGHPICDSLLYHSLAGALQYLTFTPLNISYAGHQIRIGLVVPPIEDRLLVIVFFLAKNLLSWSSKRQPTLSRSSAEVEYRGVANVVAESCWL
nr:ribonuclease H-like domain-containing protein [Tanacetum cinerariifolium]